MAGRVVKIHTSFWVWYQTKSNLPLSDALFLLVEKWSYICSWSQEFDVGGQFLPSSDQLITLLRELIADCDKKDKGIWLSFCLVGRYLTARRGFKCVCLYSSQKILLQKSVLSLCFTGDLRSQGLERVCLWLCSSGKHATFLVPCKNLHVICVFRCLAATCVYS